MINLVVQALAGYIGWEAAAKLLRGAVSTLGMKTATELGASAAAKVASNAAVQATEKKLVSALGQTIGGKLAPSYLTKGAIGTVAGAGAMMVGMQGARLAEGAVEPFISDHRGGANASNAAYLMTGANPAEAEQLQALQSVVSNEATRQAVADYLGSDAAAQQLFGGRIV